MESASRAIIDFGRFEIDFLGASLPVNGYQEAGAHWYVFLGFRARW